VSGPVLVIAGLAIAVIGGWMFRSTGQPLRSARMGGRAYCHPAPMACAGTAARAADAGAMTRAGQARWPPGLHSVNACPNLATDAVPAGRAPVGTRDSVGRRGDLLHRHQPRLAVTRSRQASQAVRYLMAGSLPAASWTLVGVAAHTGAVASTYDSYWTRRAEGTCTLRSCRRPRQQAEGG